MADHPQLGCPWASSGRRREAGAGTRIEAENVTVDGYNALLDLMDQTEHMEEILT
jgi:hypothetical protein